MSYTVFSGSSRLAEGTLAEAASIALAHPGALIFDTGTGRVVDVDPRHPPREDAPRGPGRPRLGVVAREVTLLPRHWDWLAAQPGGASVALRKLVEAASRDPAAARRAARDAAYRFASAIAGDAPGFEEAMRALYAGDAATFRARMAQFPADVRGQLESMTSEAF